MLPQTLIVLSINDKLSKQLEHQALNSELSDGQRFTNLRSYLTDVALKSSSGFSLINGNHGKTVITMVIVLLRMIILYLKIFRICVVQSTREKGENLCEVTIGQINAFL